MYISVQSIAMNPILWKALLVYWLVSSGNDFSPVRGQAINWTMVIYGWLYL